MRNKAKILLCHCFFLLIYVCLLTFSFSCSVVEKYLRSIKKLLRGIIMKENKKGEQQHFFFLVFKCVFHAVGHSLSLFRATVNNKKGVFAFKRIFHLFLKDKTSSGILFSLFQVIRIKQYFFSFFSFFIFYDLISNSCPFLCSGAPSLNTMECNVVAFH